MTYAEISAQLDNIYANYSSNDPAKMQAARADMNQLTIDMKSAKFATMADLEDALSSDSAITL